MTSAASQKVMLKEGVITPVRIATGRRLPDLLDIGFSNPAQLSIEPLPADCALKAHQEARLDSQPASDMTRLEEVCLFRWPVQTRWKGLP